MDDRATILHLNLTSRTITTCRLSEETTAMILGGRGLTAALAFHLIPPDCDPLGPDNVLCIGNGLLTGTSAPAASRVHFSALSPLTGILGSANAGGYFGPALRSCGFQGVLIQGAACSPVYLHVDVEGARIRPADHLWGLDTRACAQRLRDDLSARRLRVVSIGPAGEMRSAMACIMLDAHSAAGRTGLGAVMGAKQLKAIAVAPADGRPQADRQARKARAAYLAPVLKSAMIPTLRRHGQAAYIPWCSEMGMLATRNYQNGVFEGAHRIGAMQGLGRVDHTPACFGCPVRCKAGVRLSDGPQGGISEPRPEFETLAALGAKCGQDDPGALLHLAGRCNRLGLDSISAGAAMAFAMELFEAGVITTADTQGLTLAWGDARVQETLLEQMAARRGFGAVLADGVRAAARRIGRGSEAFAFHSKGLELCAYDPRGSQSTALGYAVSGRGGDFAAVFASAEYRWDAQEAEAKVGDRRGGDRFSPVAKAALVRRCSICAAVVDALGICKVIALGIPAAFDLEAEAALLISTFKRPFAAADLFVAGERILNLERLFMLRQGRRPPLDRLPRRFLEEALDRGPARGRRVNLRGMLSEYYALMGWDAEGRPCGKTLRRLGLHRFKPGLDPVAARRVG